MMFLDTSGLLCYVDSRDARHAQAEAHFLSVVDRWTHDYVLAELFPLGRVRGFAMNRLFDFVKDLLASSLVNVIWVDKPLFKSGFSLLRSRPDKRYSLCDAISFQVMRRRGITQALTTDRHFEQEGFERLLTP